MKHIYKRQSRCYRVLLLGMLRPSDTQLLFRKPVKPIVRTLLPNSDILSVYLGLLITPLKGRVFFYIITFSFRALGTWTIRAGCGGRRLFYFSVRGNLAKDTMIQKQLFGRFCTAILNKHLIHLYIIFLHTHIHRIFSRGNFSLKNNQRIYPSPLKTRNKKK